MITLKSDCAIKLLPKLQDRLAPASGWEFISSPYKVQATAGRAGAKTLLGFRLRFWLLCPMQRGGAVVASDAVVP